MCSVVVVVSSARATDNEFVPPVTSWSGIILDEQLQKMAPTSNVLGDSTTFTKLWKSWFDKEPVPKVDFKSHFVVVLTAKPDKVSIVRFVVNNNGDGFIVCTINGKINDKGFGYGMAVFPRERVKTIHRNEIPKPNGG
jgi:hypothetical protein